MSASNAMAPLTLEERERLLDLDVIDEAARLRAQGWSPDDALRQALAIPTCSPRPAAVPVLRRHPPGPTPDAPAGVSSNERGVAAPVATGNGLAMPVLHARPARLPAYRAHRAARLEDQGRVRPLARLLAPAAAVLALLVISALLGGRK